MTVTLSGPMLPPRDGQQPKRLMVMLHGYGADGSDLIALGWQWGELWPDMMFVSPNAPTPCALNPSGYEWFPLSGEPIASRVAGAELAHPVIVNFLIDLWAQTGLGPADTVLCGFSQGAMMALNVGTALDRELAAIVAFSGALLPAPGFGEKPFARPPVALIHGADDPIVDPQLSRDAAATLAAGGFDVALHISPGVAHGIAPDGLEFATAFLAQRLAATA